MKMAGFSTQNNGPSDESSKSPAEVPPVIKTQAKTSRLKATPKAGYKMPKLK